MAEHLEHEKEGWPSYTWVTCSVVSDEDEVVIVAALKLKLPFGVVCLTCVCNMNDDRDDSQLPPDLIIAIQNLLNANGAKDEDALYTPLSPINVINQLFPDGLFTVLNSTWFGVAHMEESCRSFFGPS